MFKLLRGVVPYFNENRVETLRLIANADPLNDIDLTTGFSNELSSFMKGILNPDPMKRLTAEQALNHNWLHDIVKLTPLKPRDTSIIDNAVNDDEMNQAISTLSFTQIVMLKTQARRLAIKARERAAVKIQTPMRIKLAKARVAKIRMENAKKFEDSYKENISTLTRIICPALFMTSIFMATPGCSGWNVGENVSNPLGNFLRAAHRWQDE